MLIPPPPKPQSFDDDDDDVERRLQSLLDVAEEDKPDTAQGKPKDFSGLKELDRIGYVVRMPGIFLFIYLFIYLVCLCLSCSSSKRQVIS